MEDLGMDTKFWLAGLNGRDYVEDLGMDMKVT